MDKQNGQLIAFCHEFDIFETRQVIRNLELEAMEQFSTIKKEALQWLSELKEQQKGLTEKQPKNGPLLPQTPTMKRKLRKRKIPPVEDEEKENTAITRSRREASKAANSKFYNQLHVPLKLRRPSVPRVGSYVAEPKQPRPAKKMRVRLEEPSSDSEEEEEVEPCSSKMSTMSTVSTMSTATEPDRMRKRRNKVKISDSHLPSSDPELHPTSKKTSTFLEPTKKRPRRQKKAPVYYQDLMSSFEETENKSTDESKKRRLRNRNNKADVTQAAMTSCDEEAAPSVSEEVLDPLIETVRPKRQVAQKKALQEPTIEPDVFKQERVSVLKDNSPKRQHSADCEPKDMEISIMPEPRAPELVLNQVIQISLNRLPPNITDTVTLNPDGSIKVPDDDEMESEDDDMEVTVAATKTPKAVASTSKIRPQTASAGLDLVALTPHLKGRVMERVIAVEKSLKKDDPKSVIQAKKAAQKPRADTPPRNSPSKVSIDMFESAESSPEKEDEDDSPTHRAVHFKSLKSRSSGRKSIKKHKRSPSTPAHRIVVKLFDNQGFRKRSKSFDAMVASTASTSKGQSLTTGRSRVLTGVRTFLKPSAREQAQAAAIEEEKRRKVEELQRNREREEDAAKKKEEHLRLKKEQKKRENEEKRARALMAQEARAREQEEAARQEREREERKAAQQRLREEKEMAEKELRREQRLLKQAEREQRLKEEEIKAKNKAKEIAASAAQELLRRDEERRADAAKGGWAAPATKPHVAPKPTVPQPTKQTASKNTMNETFEVPSKANNPADKKAAQGTLLQKAVAAASSNNNYAMTPSRDEIPPMSPKDPDNYGIDDVKEDDPSDDDEKPKKKMPNWARGLRTNLPLNCADWVSVGIRNRLFGTRVFKPSAQELFGVNARPVHRRSSAIWNTPPNMHHQSLCSSFLE